MYVDSSEVATGNIKLCFLPNLTDPADILTGAQRRLKTQT